MADDDEIDVLGEFSFNSCLAQNSQGIPSCSDREDTVHPEWLLDSTATNWYDQKDYRLSTITAENTNKEAHTPWTLAERDVLIKGMRKYGRDVKKISQTLTTRTEAEIQALIEAEHGVNLETQTLGLCGAGLSLGDVDDVPNVVQEEIVTDDDAPDDTADVISMVTTGSPTVPVVNKKQFRTFKDKVNRCSKNSLLKPDVLLDIKNSNVGLINSDDLIHDRDLVVGSTESVGAPDNDSTDYISNSILKEQIKTEAKIKQKVVKKIGNHRRKYFKSSDKFNIQCVVRKANTKDDILKSPSNRQRKYSTLSNDSSQSTKLQIVLGSGQALPLSEGEQVIKIEKKKDSDSDSDIDVDVDSDNKEDVTTQRMVQENDKVQTIKPKDHEVNLLQQRRFEKMPRRKKKINLDGSGGGGCTIMHTEAGDLYEVASEPRRERPRRAPPVALLHCKMFSIDRPAPYEVELCVSALVCMDAQAHASRGEVMGLVGGALRQRTLTVSAYRPAAAAASRTHCDMCPVSQALAAERLLASGVSVVGWHHSHPTFPAAPSLQDLRTQRALQQALERPSAPFLGLITSQHWLRGRTATHYRCIRVEEEAGADVGYQLRVRLSRDLTAESVPGFLEDLRSLLRDHSATNHMPVDVHRDLCPEAGLTYLQKCVSSVSHHLLAAGYPASHPVTLQLLQGLPRAFT